MDLYIIKLGGSVITYKKANKFKAHTPKIKRIASEIKRARKKKKFKLIIVHGAGPFGHTLVKRYKINNGIRTKKQAAGFVKTHNSVETLARAVISEFQKQGLLAMQIQPSATIIQQNKKIIGFYLEPLDELLSMSQEIIPIMYGDVVIDLTLKGSVVSGDAIVPYLAKKMNAKKVFLGTDVKGICTSDPNKSKKAKLIPKITSKNISKVLKQVSQSKAVDVTAGMKGKLEKLQQMQTPARTYIFNLNKKNNLYKLLTGKKIPCTEVYFAK